MRLGPAPTFRRTLFGLVFLPHGFLLLGMLLVAWFFVEQTNHQTEKQNAKIAQGLALQVWDQLTARVQVLDQLAAVLEVTPSERHQALFERLASQYPVFEGVYLLDPGLLVRGEWPRNQNLVGNDFSGQQVLRRLGALQQVVWSDSFVSPRTGRSTVTLARTYPGGILSANLDLNPLTQLVTQLAKGTEVSVALVDAYGTYLAHPDPKVALRRQPDLKYLSYRETRGPGAFFYTEERQGITDVVSVQPLPETGWAVLVSQPLSSTYLPLAPLLFLLLPMIVLFVLGVGVLVYILDRHLLGALKTLKRQTDSLSQGDFGGGEVRTRYQDLNAILDSYDAMRQSIWQREQDIRLGEKRFRRMFEDAAIGIFYSSYSGEILDLNKTMAELLGSHRPMRLSKRYRMVLRDSTFGPRSEVPF